MYKSSRWPVKYGIPVNTPQGTFILRHTKYLCVEITTMPFLNFGGKNLCLPGPLDRRCLIVNPPTLY